MFELRLLLLLRALCMGGWGGECIASRTDKVLHGYQGLQLPILVVGMVYSIKGLVFALPSSFRPTPRTVPSSFSSAALVALRQRP